MKQLSGRIDQVRTISSSLHMTRMALRFNALSCFVFGLMFVFTAPTISKFLGGLPELWLVITGTGLLVHAMHLIWGSTRTSVSRIEIFYFTAGDILWFIVSLAILMGTSLISTYYGVISTLIVAIMVLTIGIVQLWFFNQVVRAEKSILSVNLE